MMSKAASPLQKALRRFTSGNPDKFFVEIISPLLSNFNCHPSTFILPQFRERGNREFSELISDLMDIRGGQSFRCRLRVVHRWAAPWKLNDRPKRNTPAGEAPQRATSGQNVPKSGERANAGTRRHCRSPRKLQTLRDNGTLAYSQINHKTYYRPEDVQRIVSVVEDRRKEARFKGRTI